MMHVLWILVRLVVLTELLTLPPVVARGAVPGGIKWIFYNRDTALGGVAPWGDRAVRAHDNMANNLALYAAVILIAIVTGAANDTTALAGTALLAARVLYAAVYIAGIPLFAHRGLRRGAACNAGLSLADCGPFLGAMKKAR